MFHFFDNCLQSLLAIADNFLGEKRCRASYLPLHEVFAVSVFLKLSCYILLTVYLMYCLPFKTIDSREQSVSTTTHRSLVAQVFLELSIVLLISLFFLHCLAFNHTIYNLYQRLVTLMQAATQHECVKGGINPSDEETHLCNNHLLGNAGGANH